LFTHEYDLSVFKDGSSGKFLMIDLKNYRFFSGDALRDVIL